MSHSSGVWEVRDHRADRFSVWWGPAFSWTAVFSLWTHMAEGTRELSGVFFIRAPIPFTRFLLSWPNHLPKALSSNTVPQGLVFHMWIGDGVERNNILSIALSFLMFFQHTTCVPVSGPLYGWYFPRAKVPFPRFSWAYFLPIMQPQLRQISPPQRGPPRVLSDYDSARTPVSVYHVIHFSVFLPLYAIPISGSQLGQYCQLRKCLEICGNNVDWHDDERPLPAFSGWG